MGVDLRVLGPLEVVVDGEVRALGGPLPTSLLAELSCQLGRAVPVGVLVEEVWAGGGRGSARSVQVYVSDLRRTLGDPKLLRSQSGGYLLDVDPGDLDAHRFETLLADGSAAIGTGDHTLGELTLRRALALWRGPAFADITAQVVSEHARRLDELRLVATQGWIDALLAMGRHEDAVPRLQELVALEPTRETLRGQLVLALYRCGRQAEALAAYDQGRRVLAEELGLDPAAALRRLYEQVLRQDPELDVESAALRARRRLPTPPTGFLGRVKELATLTELVRGQTRLLTITGPGGSGKTRLAQQPPGCTRLGDRGRRDAGTALGGGPRALLGVARAQPGGPRASTRRLGPRLGRRAAHPHAGLMRAGVFAAMQGDLDDALALYEESLDMARNAGDIALTARAMRNLAANLRDRGDLDHALEMHDEARLLSLQAGDRSGVASSWVNMADVALARGDHETARRYAVEGVRIDREIGNDVNLSGSLINLGLACLRLDLVAESTAAYVEALELCEANRFAEGTAYGLLGVAELLARQEEPTAAAQLLGAADAQLTAAGAVLESTEQPLRDDLELRLANSIGDQEMRRQAAEGAAWSLASAAGAAQRLAKAIREGAS